MTFWLCFQPGDSVLPKIFTPIQTIMQFSVLAIPQSIPCNTASCGTPSGIEAGPNGYRLQPMQRLGRSETLALMVTVR
jgi:hypothetical protein